MRYPAWVTMHDNGRFTVRVPDVPGAITYGDTEADALARAQRVVRVVIYQLMLDRRPVPVPSTLADAWVEIPPDEAAAIERYMGQSSTSERGLRHLISSLASDRRRRARQQSA
jgi:predicted RNase H-like HicB family nuclease